MADAPPPTLANPTIDKLRGTASNGNGGEADKLSDYVPGSNDLSRQVSVSARQSEDEADGDAMDLDQKDDGAEEEEENEEADEDDELEAGPSTTPAKAAGATKASKPKTPAAIKREAAKLEKQSQRAAANEKKKENEGKLSERRKEVGNKKLADSIKRFSYLLGQTDLFRHFCDLKKEREPEFARMLEESEKLMTEKSNRKGKKAAKRGGDESRRRKSEKEEDEELLNDAGEGEGDEDEPFVFTESPSYVKGGIMRDYQVQGLNWLVSLHHNGINGILADEMGLGKTLQTISFLGYLKHSRDLGAPHLVVVPKSTLQNWAREFGHWVPSFDVCVLTGTKDERAEIVRDRILPQKFDICITTYEMVLREKSALKKIGWEYIIIDEAHRIKNVDSVLSQIVREFPSRARLLITGTPLQNNLQELWALLNFLLPDVFSSSEDFDRWFESRTSTATDKVEGGDAKKQEEAEKDSVVKQLHKVLRPFLLRRVKVDVEKSLLPKKESNIYVGMTEMQRKWYKMILEKNIDAVNGAGGKEGKTRLLNIVMQLRKCCNHPYLFDGAEPGPPYTNDVHLVDNSGKMVVLDKLLKAMKAKGSRVLIFSQMSRVLDIMEDYCHFRDYSYCRIDGQTAHEDRTAAIDEYNKEGSEKFIFLLTTRAGGLGINLTTADVVVLFDSDWNPQADLQAMDRAHRIGQKKQVYVYRFVTENSVEEKVLERAAQKLRLDQLVIQQGRAAQSQKAHSKDDLVGMIQHGAEKIINASESMITDEDIDAIISRGQERTAELNSRYAELEFDDLANFKSETTTTWEGEDYAKKRGALGKNWIELSKRERKHESLKFEAFYQRDKPAKTDAKKAAPKAPRAPKELKTADHQFFPRRFIELQERETAYWKRSTNYQVPLRQDEAVPSEDLEEERAAEQAKIDAAEPLTEAEQQEKEELASLGFESWSKRDFQAFIRALENNDKDDYTAIAAEISKSPEDVQSYSDTFWSRYEEIDDWQKLLTRVESGQKKREQTDYQSQLLMEKITESDHPLQTMKIPYFNQSKGKSYAEDEDRFLLFQLHKYGLGSDDTYDLIKREISEWPGFRFNWFLKSRTSQELSRRCTTLLGLLVREAEEEKEEVKVPAGKKKGRPSAADKEAKDKAKSEDVKAAPAVNVKGKGKKRAADEASTSDSPSRASTPAGGPAKKKAKTKA